MDTAVIEKFWKYVDKTSYCWNWTGTLDKKGKPNIRIGGRSNGKEYSARRVALELSGRILDPMIATFSACRNAVCVNPDHIAYGTEALFWAKVTKLSEANGGCWIWIAGQDKDMYGKFTYTKHGKSISGRAHIYSWELYTGRPVPPFLKVCHHCDHPYCVNPQHLFLGSHQDNEDDKDQKGRRPRGEDIWHLAKMTEYKVKQMRELHKNGVSVLRLSQMFGLARSSTRSIVTYESWKHVA
jgi:hypothetical protein